MAAIGEKKGGGRTPGADTLAYRPLAEDFNDVMGNYNLTATDGSDYAFTVNAQGKACCQLNSSNTSKTYLNSGINAGNIFDIVNHDYTFVCNICDFSSTLSSSWDAAMGFSLGSQMKGPCINTSNNPGYAPCHWELLSNQTATGGDTSEISLRGSDFVTIISVWDHTNKVMTTYINGVYKMDYTYSGSIRGYGTFMLCRDQYSTSATRCVHGKIRDFIIETKQWTQQDIDNYMQYNA